MLEYILIIALILAAGCWIINPLFKPARFNYIFDHQADDAVKQLEHRKEAAYATIRELEFDLNMGKLSEEDYRILREQYKLDAIRCLKEIDTLRMNQKITENLSEEDLEEEIERQVAFFRKRHHGRNGSIFCVKCGTEISYQGRFCHHCGARLVAV